MKIKFNKIYIVKNNKKIKISIEDDLSKYLELTFDDDYYIRFDLRNRIYFKLKNNTIFLSNSIKNLINDVNLINFNQGIKDNYLKCGFIPPPYTIFENIFCIVLHLGISKRISINK